MSNAVVSTNLPLANKRQGKVRDLYDLVLPDGGEGILIIATDRISVFDVVLANRQYPSRHAAQDPSRKIWNGPPE